MPALWDPSSAVCEMTLKGAIDKFLFGFSIPSHDLGEALIRGFQRQVRTIRACSIQFNWKSLVTDLIIGGHVWSIIPAYSYEFFFCIPKVKAFIF